MSSKMQFVPDFPKDLKAYNSKLSLETAYQRILSVGLANGDIGCIQPEELADSLLQSAKKKFVLRAYDGFEPSGRMHIAQGLMKTTNVNKLTSSGIHFTFLVADWFAQLNNKFKGDLSKIRKVGQYFLEIWKACGMNLEHVSFVWSSEEVNKRPDEYWQMVMDIARKNSVARVKRCGQIMGRSGDADSAQNESLLRSIFRSREADAALNEDEFVRKHLPSARSDNQPVAQLLYPLMQCADVFFLRSSICQLGLDQLKVNVLAREYCDQLKGEKKRLRKPIVLSHPMLMGLKQGQAKMSKSNPDSAIFMEDSEAEVERKMKRAYCKPGDVEENPVLDYLDKVVFPWYENDENQKRKDSKNRFEFIIERDDKNGGLAKFYKFEEVETAFKSEKLHPSDLKKATAREINILLEPVRKHFSTGKAKELLKQIRSFRR